MSCSGEAEAWRRMFWDKSSQMRVSEKIVEPRIMGHGFLLYCKRCEVILGCYASLCHVPFMLRCSLCGRKSKARFQRSFHRLSDVSVTSVQGDLGQQLLRMVEEGKIRRMQK